MPAKQSETTPPAERRSNVTVRVTDLSASCKSANGIAGFAATVEYADPSVVPFNVGDAVFGVTDGGSPSAPGDMLSLKAEHLCARPPLIPAASAARLARNAVIAWLALFEWLAMEVAADRELALVEIGDMELGLLLVWLLQRLTKVDVIVGTDEVGPWRSVLRPNRDVIAHDSSALAAILVKETRTPRYLVLARDPKSRLFDLNDIISLLQQDVGSVRVLDLAWIKDVDWDTVLKSRCAVSDILAEVMPIFHSKADVLFETFLQTT